MRSNDVVEKQLISRYTRKKKCMTTNLYRQKHMLTRGSSADVPRNVDIPVLF
jgi:hypothetical protein